MSINSTGPFPKISRDDFDGNLVCGGPTFNRESHRLDVIEATVNEESGAELMFLDSGARERNPDFFEPVNECPVCWATQTYILINRPTLTIVRCLGCGHGRQAPRPTKQALALFYSKTYNMNDTYASDVGKQLDELKFQYGVQQARKVDQDLNCVLDVGCGPGLSLVAYQNVGIRDAFGIDPGVYPVLESPNVDTGVSIENAIPTHFRNLDLVSFWDVLEHIGEPIRMLQSVHQALRPGGVVLVLVPNLLSLATRLIRQQSPTFCIDHLQYFTRSSLRKALEQAQFKIVSEETVISEIDNCRNYLNMSDPYTGANGEEDDFPWLSSDYIHSNFLGSRLLFIGQKVVN